MVRVFAVLLFGWSGVVGLVACDPSFDPPTTPAHDDVEDGSHHADDNDTPFLCADPVTGRRVACPIGRPADEDLSCDAAGCHGDNDYSEAVPADQRSLRGSDGPSCYTCHDVEWMRIVQ